MIDSSYFVDVFETVVDDVRADYNPIATAYNSPDKEPYYIYGHQLEITNRLTKKNDGSEKFEKYPLIALFQDFTEDHGNPDPRIDYTIPFTVIIVASTENTYISKERYDNVFKTTLYPLYRLLLQKIDRSPYIITDSEERIKHLKTDRLFWGTAGTYGNQALIFNDNLDAIEINFSGLDIIKTYTQCQ